MADAGERDGAGDAPGDDVFAGISAVRADGKVRVMVSPDVDASGEPAQVVLLVDTSGSMANVDPLVLKATVQRVLRHFATTNTPVSVLTCVTVRRACVPSCAHLPPPCTATPRRQIFA